MLQVDEVIRLLEERYLIHAISYEKHHRRERIQYPEDSLRESVLNAIINKDYTSGYPIQISVYPDHLSVWNYGQLPVGWSVGRLFVKHPSMPFNPSIANVFFLNRLDMVPELITRFETIKWLTIGSRLHQE